MTDKITFTPLEKRVLELKQDFDERDEAAFVLRSLIDHFPFILDIADHGFNHDIAAAILIREAKTIQAEAECERKIQELVK